MDEQGTTEPQATQDSAASGQPTPQSFIGEDGDLKDGWRDAYLTDDIKQEKIWDRVKTVQNAFKSLASAERMIGKDKIAIPNENSGQAEWDAFYRVAGRPEKPEEYGFKRPEEMPAEYWSDDRAKKFQDVFHKAGIGKKQADMIIEAYNADILEEIKSNSVNSELRQDELVAALKKEWGTGYDSKIHAGNVAIEQYSKGNEEVKAGIISKFGNDPDFIKFAAALGSKFVEKGSVFTPTDGGVNVGQIQEEIAKLMNSDAFNNKNNPEHKFAMEKYNQLFKKKHSLSGKS